MTHLTNELLKLKATVAAQGRLVSDQLRKTRDGLISFDKKLQQEVCSLEATVNSEELRIDRECENIIALLNPLAADLRFVLACIKINVNLERNGDIADGISRFLLNLPAPYEQQLLEQTQALEMFNAALEMMDQCVIAFEAEDSVLARTILGMDSKPDQINSNVSHIVADYIRTNPSNIEQALYIMSTIRKLERVGDQCKNIAEEIIFFHESKVMKHRDTR